MALYYDLPVYRDVYRLILKIFEYTKDFPREYKYSFGQDLKHDSIVLVRSIYRANKAKSKTEYLEVFLDDFEILKLEVRLCVDLKILPMKKQAEITGLMDGIGKQITGWRNAAEVNELRNIHPGEVLMEEFLIPLEISAYRLSKDIGIPQTRISGIVKGKRRVTADTALRLSQYFGNSAKFWLGLQDDYDLEEGMQIKREAIHSILRYKSSMMA